LKGWVPQGGRRTRVAQRQKDRRASKLFEAASHGKTSVDQWKPAKALMGFSAVPTHSGSPKAHFNVSSKAVRSAAGSGQKLRVSTA
jgi:hypothetical protein